MINPNETINKFVTHDSLIHNSILDECNHHRLRIELDYFFKISLIQLTNFNIHWSWSIFAKFGDFSYHALTSKWEDLRTNIARWIWIGYHWNRILCVSNFYLFHESDLRMPSGLTYYLLQFCVTAYASKKM